MSPKSNRTSVLRRDWQGRIPGDDRGRDGVTASVSQGITGLWTPTSSEEEATFRGSMALLTP